MPPPNKGGAVGRWKNEGNIWNMSPLFSALFIGTHTNIKHVPRAKNVLISFFWSSFGWRVVWFLWWTSFTPWFFRFRNVDPAWVWGEEPCLRMLPHYLTLLFLFTPSELQWKEPNTCWTLKYPDFNALEETTLVAPKHPDEPEPEPEPRFPAEEICLLL